MPATQPAAEWNGDTLGAGSASTAGIASRFTSIAQVPFNRPERSITAGFN
jgi:hypothetical protein